MLSADEATIINERSLQLIDEYNAHVESVDNSGKLPPVLDCVIQDKYFGGWAIQKIASLQLVVESLSEHVKLLQNVVLQDR